MERMPSFLLEACYNHLQEEGHVRAELAATYRSALARLTQDDEARCKQLCAGQLLRACKTARFETVLGS